MVFYELSTFLFWCHGGKATSGKSDGSCAMKSEMYSIFDLEMASKVLQKALIANADDEAKEIANLAMTSARPDQSKDYDVHLKQAVLLFEDFVLRRSRGEPLARLRGWSTFCELRFEIGDGVLVPRSETELLVEIGSKKVRPNDCVLDLGTGCGAIAVAMAKAVPSILVDAVDNSIDAVRYATKNVIAHNVDQRCNIILGDWYSSARCYDLVLSNPPYVADNEISSLSIENLLFEPKESWYGGPDGLSAYRSIIDAAPARIKPGGWIGLEIGWRQAKDIAGLMASSGFGEIQVFERMSGLARVMFARLDAPACKST